MTEREYRRVKAALRRSDPAAHERDLAARRKRWTMICDTENAKRRENRARRRKSKTPF